jgi:hypothetical protein
VPDHFKDRLGGPKGTPQRESPQKRMARAETRGGPRPNANGGKAVYFRFASRTASAIEVSHKAQPAQQRESGLLDGSPLVVKSRRADIDVTNPPWPGGHIAKTSRRIGRTFEW